MHPAIGYGARREGIDVRRSPFSPPAAFVSLGGLSLLLAATACGGGSAKPTSQPDAGSSGSTALPQSDAGDLGYLVCARLDDAPECFACCSSYYPYAQKRLIAAAASCACTPAYCGPTAGDGGGASDGALPDGSNEAGDAMAGVDSGDADADAARDANDEAVNPINPDIYNPFGLGACSATMCSQQAAPSVSCVTCTQALIEGSEGHPLCPESYAACAADPVCMPLLRCSSNCPGAVPD